MFCAWCGNEVATVSYAPCPRCGKPSNGAQTVLTSGGGSNPAVVVVLVVFGGLFVVAIIGILAAIAIPNLLTATQRSKQKRTMADLRMIGVAVDSFASDNANAYPKVSSLDELKPLLTPKYLPALPAVDGWGRPLRYECMTMEEERCTAYVISSGGKNGVFEEPPEQVVQTGSRATTNFDCDLIYSNGQFIQYPEGVQH